DQRPLRPPRLGQGHLGHRPPLACPPTPGPIRGVHGNNDAPPHVCPGPPECLPECRAQTLWQPSLPTRRPDQPPVAPTTPPFHTRPHRPQRGQDYSARRRLLDDRLVSTGSLALPQNSVARRQDHRR